MIIRSDAVFACYSKVCAPPPAGRGGSSPKGKTMLTAKDFRDGERSQAGWNARMAKERQQREEAKMVYARKNRRKANAERYSKDEVKAVVRDWTTRKRQANARKKAADAVAEWERRTGKTSNIGFLEEPRY